jgi:hypothetical protein
MAPSKVVAARQYHLWLVNKKNQLVITVIVMEEARLQHLFQVSIKKLGSMALSQVETARL